MRVSLDFFISSLEKGYQNSLLPMEPTSLVLFFGIPHKNDLRSMSFAWSNRKIWDTKHHLHNLQMAETGGALKVTLSTCLMWTLSSLYLITKV